MLNDAQGRTQSHQVADRTLITRWQNARGSKTDAHPMSVAHKSVCLASVSRLSCVFIAYESHLHSVCIAIANRDESFGQSKTLVASENQYCVQ